MKKLALTLALVVMAGFAAAQVTPEQPTEEPQEPMEEPVAPNGQATSLYEWAEQHEATHQQSMEQLSSIPFFGSNAVEAHDRAFQQDMEALYSLIGTPSADMDGDNTMMDGEGMGMEQPANSEENPQN